MRHFCHPFQLGNNKFDTPPEHRDTFALDLDGIRLVSGDHIQHGGADFIVDHVTFRASGFNEPVDSCDVQVRWNGAAHNIAPYYEAPFSNGPTESVS